MAVERPECLHSQLSEKVIRHQLEQAAVSANKKLRRGCSGQGDGGGVKSQSDRRTLGLAIQVNADGTAANTDASCWCQLNVSHVCMLTSVYGYDMSKTLGVCVLGLNLKVRWNYTHTHTHCLSVISQCPGYEMNMEELEQKAQWHWDKVIGMDRCVCECRPVCRCFVPGQQVASQRTSVTFSFCLPISSSLCPPLCVSPSPHSSHPRCKRAVSAQQVMGTVRR